MWYKVNELKSKGLNKSQISKELGIDRATVRKYISMNESEFYQWIEQIRCMPNKLQSYYEFIKNLLEREWIKVLGQKEVPGRPELLGTTRQFLDYFGLRSLDDLPNVLHLSDLPHAKLTV